MTKKCECLQWATSRDQWVSRYGRKAKAMWAPWFTNPPADLHHPLCPKQARQSGKAE